MIYKRIHVQAKDGNGALKLVTKFGLEDLFRHFEKDEYPGIVYIIQA